MSERDRIAEIEGLTVKEFKEEIQSTIQHIRDGIRPGNSIELLATALNIGFLGEDLKTTLEQWLQLDLWKKVDDGDSSR